MNVIFFGSSIYVLPIIAFLHKRYDLKLVVTTEQKLTDPVVKYCHQHKIPFLRITNLKDKDILERISLIGSPVAVLASFGLLVGKHVREIFPKGVVNIHPSLLPLYRGPTPVQSALLDGVTKTGVTIILLDREVDHGPILAQKEELVRHDDTSLSLYTRLFEKGIELLDIYLDDYIEGRLESKEQDHFNATITDKLTKENGFVDLKKLRDYALFERMVRAYYPWPTVWTKLSLVKQKKEEKDRFLLIKFLPGNEKSTFLIQPEGKNAMTIRDFLNGHGEMKEYFAMLSPSK